MPAPLFSKEEVVERLSDEFRRWGYDGATLSRLSQATGLGKASLYHHFPKGKEDMARAVLDYLGERFATTVLKPLSDENQPAAERLRAFGFNVAQFYSQGRTSCVLDVFSLGTAGELFSQRMRDGMLGLKAAVIATLSQLDLSEAEVEARAARALMTIHGSLVVGRATGRHTFFQAAMQEMGEWLTAPPTAADGSQAKR